MHHRNLLCWRGAVNGSGSRRVARDSRRVRHFAGSRTRRISRARLDNPFTGVVDGLCYGRSSRRASAGWPAPDPPRPGSATGRDQPRRASGPHPRYRATCQPRSAPLPRSAHGVIGRIRWADRADLLSSTLHVSFSIRSDKPLMWLGPCSRSASPEPRSPMWRVQKGSRGGATVQDPRSKPLIKL